MNLELHLDANYQNCSRRKRCHFFFHCQTKAENNFDSSEYVNRICQSWKAYKSQLNINDDCYRYLGLGSLCFLLFFCDELFETHDFLYSLKCSNYLCSSILFSFHYFGILFTYETIEWWCGLLKWILNGAWSNRIKQCIELNKIKRFHFHIACEYRISLFFFPPHLHLAFFECI